VQAPEMRCNSSAPKSANIGSSQNDQQIRPVYSAIASSGSNVKWVWANRPPPTLSLEGAISHIPVANPDYFGGFGLVRWFTGQASGKNTTCHGVDTIDAGLPGGIHLEHENCRRRHRCRDSLSSRVLRVRRHPSGLRRRSIQDGFEHATGILVTCAAPPRSACGHRARGVCCMASALETTKGPRTPLTASPSEVEADMPWRAVVGL